MWSAVLLRVLQDITGATKSADDDFEAAVRWVGSYPTRDFQIVCTLAGFEPAFVHERLIEKISDKQRQFQHPGE